LIVCNLLVVVTHLYKIFNNGEDVESTLATISTSVAGFSSSGHMSKSTNSSNLTSVHFSTTGNISDSLAAPKKS
jgi:hypothetical protein